MHFERLYDDDLAASTYIIGCDAAQEALVVDPLYTIGPYLDRLDALGYALAGVVETHIHADFVSGGRSLAQAHDVPLYVSAETPREWLYDLTAVDGRTLSDGDMIELGNVTLEAKHTPGHTPEHLAYVVTDGARTDAPAMLLSGDFVFVGDLGRPDLLENAAGEEGSARKLARKQLESLTNTLMELPVDVQIWPGHGAGSACGGDIGSVPGTTVGYERKSAWWAPYVGQKDTDGFVEELLAGQPEVPAYFGRMKTLNRDGVDHDVTMIGLPRLTPKQAERLVEAEGVVIDLASPGAFAEGHAVGALNLPSLDNLSTHAGAAMSWDRPAVLHCRPEQVDQATAKLHNVGMFNIAGWVPRSTPIGPVETSLRLDARTAAESVEGGAIPLDVRSAGEFADEHVDGAQHAHYGDIAHGGVELAKDAKYVVYCGSGIRASIATSVLAARGYQVANGGGYDALSAAL